MASGRRAPLPLLRRAKSDLASTKGKRDNKLTSRLPSEQPCHMRSTVVHVRVSRFWSWKGYRIRYQRSGDSGPAVLLVHGFGGNADHWRKNTPVLGQRHQAYAIDLLGYGYSDKPDPRCVDVLRGDGC